ncbi:MAG: hypothetical protein ACI4R5_06915 [Acetatifactor sp.]
MEKRQLKDLNLIDNFLFGSVMTYPGIGEKFSRRLLQIIFQRDFGKLKVMPQKVYYGNDTHLHGARLDVYLEEEIDEEAQGEIATIYDVEPDKNDGTKDIASVPKRIRFYHAKIDSRSLLTGETYEALKNVFIIMIVPYDPFGLDRMVYTIKSGCMEEPEMPYEDGTRTIFLYTRGTKGNPPQELRELLHYMEQTTEGNVKSNGLAELHHMVEQVKLDAEVTIAYMRLMEDERILLARGREEGRTEGRTEGRAEGLSESVLDFLEELGAVPDELRKRITTQTDMTVLKAWLKCAARAESIESFQKMM